MKNTSIVKSTTAKGVEFFSTSLSRQEFLALTPEARIEVRQFLYIRKTEVWQTRTFFKFGLKFVGKFNQQHQSFKPKQEKVK